MKRRTARVLLYALLVGVLAAVVMETGVWRLPWAGVVALAERVHREYGVDVPVALAAFGLGELFFLLSIVMLLREAGARIDLRAIHSFDFHSLRLGSPRMLGWLWVNRASWIVPWLLVLAMSAGKVPWWASVAGLAEVAVTFSAGVAITAGLKLPWWNEPAATPQNTESSSTPGAATLRVATLDDAESLAALERDVWGEGAASREQLEARIANCPRGNIMAIAPDGRPCGLTSFCLIDYERFESAGHTTWNDLSGNGTGSTNDPHGHDLFGINLGVAGWAPRGTSVRLLAEVVRAGVRAGVHRGVLGARMPGYRRWAERLTPQEYWVAERKPGVPLDPELRYYYAFGMKPVRLVEEYFEDPASLNWGVIVQMDVPWYVRIFGPLLAALPIDLAGLLERLG